MKLFDNNIQQYVIRLSEGMSIEQQFDVNEI